MLNIELVKHFEERIRKGGYKRVINTAEWIVLRPNDQKLFMGEEKYNAYVEAEKRVLEDYKDDDIYKYFYTVTREKYGFCNFERWKKKMFILSE